MEITLNEIESRVLGCLIEKEITTPDYYPLTLNALTNACNQKSNRNPVVSYDETTVVRGLDDLSEKGLAKKVFAVGSRVQKYQHAFLDKFDLGRREVAVLCELMVRGPQTAGELRTHAGRMYEFKGLEEVDEVLQGLMEYEGPMVIKLPRQAGRKEQRYMHLFSGKPETKGIEQAAPLEPAAMQTSGENDRIAKLEEELAMLRKEFDEMKQAFIEFKSQFK